MMAGAGQEDGRGGTRRRGPRELRLLVAATALTWVAPLFGSGHTAPRWALIGLGGGVLLVGAGRLGLSRLLPRGLRHALDVALMSVVMSALLLEGSLQVLARVFPLPLFVTRETGPIERLAAHRTAAGKMHYGFPCNAGGHYDVEPEDLDRSRPLVVSIGDSFSLGVVPHSFHFTTLAEERLGGEIYNMGVPGTGPAEYLYQLRHEALALEPDVVVIQLFVGNDVADPGRARHASTQQHRRSFTDSLLLPLVVRRATILLREEHLRPALPEEADGGFRKRRIRGRAELLRRFPWLEDPSQEKPTFSKQRFLTLELARARATCGPDLTPFERLFRDLEAMREACAGTPLALVLIPDEFQVEDVLWDELREKAPHYRFDRDGPQRRIREWAESRGVPVLDLLPRLRALPVGDDGRRHCYHRQDTHFNARGNQVAGEALAEFLGPLIEEGRR